MPIILQAPHLPPWLDSLICIICLLAKYLTNQRTAFNETLKVITTYSATVFYFQSQLDSKWPKQLMNLSERKNGYTSINSLNIELTVIAAVAENHPQHITLDLCLNLWHSRQ